MSRIVEVSPTISGANSFEEIFKRYYNRLCYFAWQIVGDKHEAEDVVQDTFIKFWDNRSDYLAHHTIKSFLYTTTKNSCLNKLRHKEVIQNHETRMLKYTDGNSYEIDHTLIKTEVLQHIHKAMQTLPEGCRKVFELSYFEEMRNPEIADLLNVSINTVKTQKYRALDLLRYKLKHLFQTEAVFLVCCAAKFYFF